MPNKRYTWYLEPQGDVAHANKVISQKLGSIADESFCEGIVCADRKQHDLWCLPGTVTAFWNSQGTLQIKFNVFCQINGGKVRQVKNLYRRRKRRKKR